MIGILFLIFTFYAFTALLAFLSYILWYILCTNATLSFIISHQKQEILAFHIESIDPDYHLHGGHESASHPINNNVHPRICYQLFSTGQHSSNYNAMLTAIKEIGANLEVYRMYSRAGQEAGSSKTLNQVEMVEIGLGPGAEEEVGALSWNEKKKGKGKGNVPP